MTKKVLPENLRSRLWFNNPADPEMTGIYLERYLNYGLTLEELRSGKPIIGIAQTGSDLSPCNRHHIDLARRVRDGVAAAGGVVMEIPVHPIQETGKRPTASLDRNLAYLSLVESLFGYPDRRRCSEHWLRQDHASPADGRRHCKHPGHRLSVSVRCSMDGLRVNELAQARLSGKRVRCMAKGEIDDEEMVGIDRLFRPFNRLLQHDGHRFDHELLG